MLGLAAIGASAQTQVSDNDLTNAYTSRSYSKRVVCHDPSIVVDDITNPARPPIIYMALTWEEARPLRLATTRNGLRSKRARRQQAM